MSDHNANSAFLSLSEAAACLGEVGERHLEEAHVERRVTLLGRRRDDKKLADTHEPIPPEAFVEYRPDGDGAVRFNLEVNSIEANADTKTYRQFERYARTGWEDVRVARFEVEALKKRLTGTKYVSALDEKDCRAWLAKEMRAARERPKTKQHLRVEADEKWKHLSDRGFDRAWAEAVKDTGAEAWMKGGRRPKGRNE